MNVFTRKEWVLYSYETGVRGTNTSLNYAVGTNNK